jgi:hypothetical protein
MGMGFGLATDLPGQYPDRFAGDPCGERLDVTGVVLSAIGLGLLLYPLVEGRETGWPVWSLAMLGAAIPILAVFAWHQYGKSRREKAPLL